jgi:hypothetical protein
MPVAQAVRIARAVTHRPRAARLTQLAAFKRRVR